MSFSSILENVTDAENRSLEYILLACIFFFALVTAIFFGMLMGSRVRKISIAKGTELIRPEFENLLVQYLFEEVDLPQLLSAPSIRKALSKKWKRSILLKEILKLHDNFSGEYAAKLELFYRESDLIHDSRKKLKSVKWDTRCKGIRELTQMNSVSSYDRIVPFTLSSNKVLRREAQFSVLTLKGLEGLSFLEDYTESLSEWEQLNFITILTREKSAKSFDPAPYIRSANDHVKIFAIRLCVELGQPQALPVIAGIFPRSSEAVKIAAVNAFGRLHYSEAADMILEHYQAASPPLKLEMLGMLGKTGNDRSAGLLRKETGNPDFPIRMAAARALYHMSGNSALPYLEEDEELKTIALHLQEERTYV